MKTLTLTLITTTSKALVGDGVRTARVAKSDWVSYKGYAKEGRAHLKDAHDRVVAAVAAGKADYDKQVARAEVAQAEKKERDERNARYEMLPINADYEILRETAKAVLLEISGKEIWLPKSQCEYIDGYIDRTKRVGELKGYVITRWIAEDKGIPVYE